jgi:hypothetical protein
MPELGTLAVINQKLFGTSDLKVFLKEVIKMSKNISS